MYLVHKLLEGLSPAYENASSWVVGTEGAPIGAFSHAIFARLKSVIALDTSWDDSYSLPYSQAARANPALLVTKTAVAFSIESTGVRPLMT